MHRPWIPLSLVLFAFAMPAPVLGQERVAESLGEIKVIRGDLYSVRVGDQYTTFLVTPGGIVLGDPLNRTAALWLKGELEQRFPDRPVRYVLVSHHQLERTGGTAVFVEAADLIGHREFDDQLTADRRKRPQEYRFAHDVETVFDGRKTVTLGDASVEIIHVGNERSPEMSLIYFPRERIVFAVDPPAFTTAPFSFGAWKPGDVFNWLHAVSTLDFDTMLFGDGGSGTRAEVVALSEYLDALRGAVATAYERGYSLAEAQTLATVPAYANGPHYASRQTHVSVLYRTVRMFRVEASAAGIAKATPRNSPFYCAGYTTCSAGGALLAGTAGVSLSLNGGLGVVAEVTYGAQFWNSRVRPRFAEEVAVRQSQKTFLFRYAPLHKRKIGYAFVGGVSTMLGDVKGVNRLEGAMLPAGGRHVITGRSSRSGLTIGADLTQRLGGQISIYVPVRFSFLKGPMPDYWPGGFDMHVGAGLRFGVFRRVG